MGKGVKLFISKLTSSSKILKYHVFSCDTRNTETSLFYKEIKFCNHSPILGLPLYMVGSTPTMAQWTSIVLILKTRAINQCMCVWSKADEVLL